jgi:enoyl-CoA hydratase/carnithine racemase
MNAPVVVERRTPAHWQVTLDNPPINLFDEAMISGLRGLADALEADDEVKVVVFTSADPDYFIAHLDLVEAAAGLDLTPGPTGLAPWPDVALRLERAPFITVGVLRGRARGVGSEFLQAMDVRFASRERGILQQPEVGMALIPGGGGLERLHRLTGRARALEIVVGADDFDADTAERYGWVNRSVPDADLDPFVERFVDRVAGFDRTAIATAKRLLNERSGLAEAADFSASQDVFFGLVARPESQGRVATLMERGLQQRGDVERDLADQLVDLRPAAASR